MKKFWSHIILALLGAGVLSCAHQVRLTVQNLYTDPAFSGRKLSGVEVAVLPLLSQQGPVRAGELESGTILKQFSKIHPELDLVGTDEFENSAVRRGGLLRLESFYDDFYVGDVLTLKGADSLWNAVEVPFLLVFRLKTGARVRSFDAGVKKQFEIECELWDSEDREVLWRSVCVGESSGQIEEGRMLFSSMSRLVESIPAVQPGYEPGSW